MEYIIKPKKIRKKLESVLSDMERLKVLPMDLKKEKELALEIGQLAKEIELRSREIQKKLFAMED